MKIRNLFAVGLATVALVAPTFAFAEIQQVRVTTTGYLCGF